MYIYVKDNPVNYHDPWGTDRYPWCWYGWCCKYKNWFGTCYWYGCNTPYIKEYNKAMNCMNGAWSTGALCMLRLGIPCGPIFYCWLIVASLCSFAVLSIEIWCIIQYVKWKCE